MEPREEEGMRNHYYVQKFTAEERNRRARCCICRKPSHNSSTCPDRKLPPMKVAYSFDLTK
jgi:hypothetical protein